MNGFKSEMSDYDWEYGIAMVGSCLVAIVAGSQRPLRQPVRAAERDCCWPNLLLEFAIAMMIAFSPLGEIGIWNAHTVGVGFGIGCDRVYRARAGAF